MLLQSHDKLPETRVELKEAREGLLQRERTVQANDNHHKQQHPEHTKTEACTNTMYTCELKAL